MDRYQKVLSDSSKENNHKTSRTAKNQELYDDFYKNSKYTEFSDASFKNVVDLSSLEKKYQTREGYQQMIKYQNVITPPKVKRDLEEYNSLYPEQNKIYDINSILKEAKKNRNEIDELERKRKLRNEEYNILSGINMEELKRFKEEKKRKIEQLQKEEDSIQTLIDTITSKTLKDDILKEQTGLLSELMPDSLDETKVTEPIKVEEKSKVIVQKIDDSVQNDKKSNLESMDKSFYTKSMDLSDKDFELDDDFSDVKENQTGYIILKILLFLVLVGIVTTVIYFVVNN